MAAGICDLAAASPDRVAVGDGTTTLTRAELNARVNRTISGLRAAGVEVGQPVAGPLNPVIWSRRERA